VDLPRSPLAARFGVDMLRQLDRALGHEHEPLNPRLPVAPYVAEQRFAEPIVHEDDVRGIIERLAQRLVSALERRGDGARRIELTLFRTDGDIGRVTAGTSRPLRDAQAIAVTWYLGTQTGHAVADVLFGDYNPSARLPVSFPRHSGQQPYFYNHPRSGRPELPGVTEFKARWREVPNAPLYAFGHGLGYAGFAYGVPRLGTQRLGWDDELVVSTTVTNTGAVAGEEVVQLYVHDRVASRVRPVRELKAFAKVALAPGEAEDVVFRLDRQQLAFTGADGVFAAEPGLFDLWVCASSASGEPVQFELLPPADV